MDARSEPFANLHLVVHPLVASSMARLRDRTTSDAEFRALVRRVSAFLLIEATRGLPLRDVEVETPFEPTTGRTLARPVVVVPILRAGLGLADGVLDLLPEARVGHVGVYRDETTLKPVPYYAKIPAEARDGTVLLVDPMLATGGTAVYAATLLKRRGCRDLAMLALLCAPEGVRRMGEAHPDVPIHAAALDRGLDANGRIRPGLGDAGDRIFGTERLLP
jgi:uracil phosphoribosyltransferase